MKQKLHNPFGLLLSLFLGALILGGYFAYWNILSKKVEASFTSQKSKQFDYKEIKTSGFPYRLSFSLVGFSSKIKTNKFYADEVFISASPFNPRMWVVEYVKTPKIIDAKQTPHPILVDNFQTSIRFNDQNKLQRLSLTFDNFKIESNGAIDIPNLNLKNGAFHIVKDDKNNRFGISIEGNNLPEGENTDAENFIIRGPISKAQDFENGLLAWNEAGGQFDIEYLKFSNEKIDFSNANGQLKCPSFEECEGFLKGDLKYKKSKLPINLDIKEIVIPIKNSKIDKASIVEANSSVLDNLNPFKLFNKHNPD